VIPLSEGSAPNRRVDAVDHMGRQRLRPSWDDGRPGCAAPADIEGTTMMLNRLPESPQSSSMLGMAEDSLPTARSLRGNESLDKE
jgi:hypothetical protein